MSPFYWWYLYKGSSPVGTARIQFPSIPSSHISPNEQTDLLSQRMKGRREVDIEYSR